LERTVAIKVLPTQVAKRPELRQRLEREAKAISSLSHPNICALYDIGHQSGIDYLVMEYLEGETLAERLAKGPLPADQVLRYGIDIAEGLENAHRNGIIHRDLKPGNIMLTKSGAKLMDFGLAKSRAAAATSSVSATLMDAKGSSQPLTAEGTVVGTFQYMSPEQIEGKEADARSDVFAFGAVLYEMTTGKRAFSGKSQASVAAAVLAFEPPPISSLQPTTPPALGFVVKTCLAKEPEDRFQSAHDLKLQLRWIEDSPSEGGGPTLRRVRSRTWQIVGITVLASFLLAAAGLAAYTRWLVRPPPVQAYIPPPEKTSFNLNYDDSAGPAVVSSDGSHFAFVASDVQGRRQVWVRALSEPSARPLAGTDGATYPFWSPDGKLLGFFADGKLKRIAAVGGPALEICAATRPRGGSWSPDGNTVLFAPDTTAPIFRVLPRPSSTPVAVTRIDIAYHTTHRWPYFLPDGNHFLYLASNHANPGPNERNGIYWASMDGKENRFLIPADSNAVY
jgi:serine/threonine protein kinase